MKFYSYACDPTLKDNNGGSLVLKHHLCALTQLGHESGGFLGLGQPVPEDADFIMFQSEWYGIIDPLLQRTNAKKICWLGHYFPHKKYSMPDITTIRADFFHTQYKGEVVEKAKALLNRDIYYLPHAGCNLCNREGQKVPTAMFNTGVNHTELQSFPDALIIRNKFNERDEEWLDYAAVEKRNAQFELLNNIYRSTPVIANLHGDFQKNIPCDFFPIPGMMMNERIFQVILAGGFCVTDNNPLTREFFSEDEVPMAMTKEEYREKIMYFVNHQEERLPYMQKAKQRILDEHLYIHRIIKWTRSTLKI